MLQHSRFDIDAGRAHAACRGRNGAVGTRHILLVDDHALFRNALALTIALRCPGITVHEAASLDAAIRKAGDIVGLAAVLYDLNLSDAAGLPGLERMLEAIGRVPLIVVSASPDPGIDAACVRLGARGFLPKSCDATVLEHALPVVLGGGIYVTPVPAVAPALQAVPPAAPRAPGRQTLTARQRDVLKLLAAGMSNKEIARTLGIFEGTVKVHVRAVIRELNVQNRTQAALKATNAGLLG